jgi:type I restriction enzyme M protein
MPLSERQLCERVLNEFIEQYGYSLDQIGVEVQISESKRADIVVYTDEAKKKPFIIIEVKTYLPYPISTYQLATYMTSIGAQYGMLTDGIRKFYFRLAGKEVMEISSIPKKGEEEEKIVSKQSLKPALRLDYKLHEIFDFASANEKLPPENVFEEVQKLMLCKLEDEKSADKNALFWINPDEAEKIDSGKIKALVSDRMAHLFDNVKMHYPELYAKGESLKLSPRTLSYSIAQLQNYSLSETPYDIVASSYRQFISKSMFGYLGQYFTPKPLVDFVVKLLDPTEEERVLDPACGSGGFLIATMHHVWRRIDQTQQANATSKSEYVRSKIFGIDVNAKMVSTCKINMLLQGNGHAHIFPADFLVNLSNLKEVARESFDIVVVDPPTGSVVSDRDVLQNFKLAKTRKTQQIQVLFLEKCVAMLKPMGHMVMVVPESLLTSPSLNYVRDYVLENTFVRAIISLPARTFVPYSGIKTSLVLLEKKLKSKECEDYDVFMAEASDAGEETLDEIVESYNRFTKYGVHVLAKILTVKSSELGRRWDVSFHALREGKRGNMLDVERKYLDEHAQLDRIVSDYDAFREVPDVQAHAVYKFGRSALVRTRCLEELAEILRGISVPSKEYLEHPGEKGALYIRISDISNGRIVEETAKRVPDIFDRVRVEAGDILLSVRGSIGKVALVSKSIEGAVPSSQLVVLRPYKNLVKGNYLLRALSSRIVQEQLDHLKVGQFISYVPVGELRRLLIPFESLQGQLRIVNRIEELERRYTKAIEEREKIRREIDQVFEGDLY